MHAVCQNWGLWGGFDHGTPGIGHHKSHEMLVFVSNEMPNNVEKPQS